MSDPNPDPKERIEGMLAYCLDKSGVDESLSLGEKHPHYMVIRGSGHTDFAMFRLDEVPDLLIADEAIEKRRFSAVRRTLSVDNGGGRVKRASSGR